MLKWGGTSHKDCIANSSAQLDPAPEAPGAGWQQSFKCVLQAELWLYHLRAPIPELAAYGGKRVDRRSTQHNTAHCYMTTLYEYREPALAPSKHKLSGGIGLQPEVVEFLVDLVQPLLVRE